MQKTKAMKKLLTFILPILVLACTSNPDQNTNNNESANETEVQIDTFKLLSDQILAEPKVASHWAERAEYFFQIGNLSDARVDYEQAIVLDSLNATYRTKYGNILIGYLELDRAKYNFEYAIKYDSLNADAYVGLGKVFAFIDNPGMATVYLNKAYSINPHLPEAYFLEGLIYRSDYAKTKREESWKRSKSSFQTAIEQNPRFYDAYIMLGAMNEAEGNDLAMEYYNSAIQIAPESTEAWFKKGSYYQAQERYEQARYCFRKINAFNPEYPEAYYSQGYIYLTKEHKYDSAIYFYNKLLEVDSLSFKAYNDLGLAYELKEDKDRAIEYYERALAINPDFETAKKNLRIVKSQ